MKLINQSVQYLPQQAGIEGVYKQVELCGRTSYLSWDKMTDDSAKKFVDMLIKSKHFSVLEHGTIYLRIPFISDSYGKSWWGETLDHDKLPSPFQEFNIINESSIKASKYYHNQYSECHIESTYKRCSPITTKRTYVDESKLLSYNESDDYKYNDDGIYFEHIAYITTNLRVLQENNWLNDLQFLCEPIKFHEKRLSVKLTTSIDITRESNRNRVLSPTEESTRYCNYSKGKYNNSISITIPSWVNEEEIPTYKSLVGFADDISNDRTDRWDDLDWWFFANLACEKSYMMLLDKGWTPQQARKVLPLGTKSEIVYTAFESAWRDWFDKRLFGKTGTPHPDMVVLATKIKEQFEKAGVWEGIMKYPSKYE